jgi:hypothetical protein
MKIGTEGSTTYFRSKKMPPCFLRNEVLFCKDYAGKIDTLRTAASSLGNRTTR